MTAEATASGTTFDDRQGSVADVSANAIAHGYGSAAGSGEATAIAAASSDVGTASAAAFANMGGGLALAEARTFGIGGNTDSVAVTGNAAFALVRAEATVPLATNGYIAYPVSYATNTIAAAAIGGQ